MVAVTARVGVRMGMVVVVEMVGTIKRDEEPGILCAWAVASPVATRPPANIRPKIPLVMVQHPLFKLGSLQHSHGSDEIGGPKRASSPYRPTIYRAERRARAVCQSFGDSNAPACPASHRIEEKMGSRSVT